MPRFLHMLHTSGSCMSAGRKLLSYEARAPLRRLSKFASPQPESEFRFCHCFCSMPLSDNKVFCHGVETLAGVNGPPPLHAFVRPQDQARHQSQPSVISTTLATQNEGGCRWWMSPSATPATPSGAASRATSGDQARHRQPSVISTTPAAQKEGGCRQVPRPPRETMVDVTKRHACHAKVPRCHGRPTGPKRRPSASPDPAKGHKYSACQAKRRWMSPSATRAT